MAMMMPARVAGLALVGSVGPGGVNVLDRFLAGRLGSTVADIGFRIASRVVNELAELAEPHVLRSFAVEQHALVHGLADVVDRLSTVRTPTVVITGTRDRVVSPQTARRLAESIPGAELLELARAGHSIPRRQPQVVASALRRLAA
jgi:pimeloyl-ACP methyl ester carboxylesterase